MKYNRGKKMIIGQFLVHLWAFIKISNEKKEIHLSAARIWFSLCASRLMSVLRVRVSIPIDNEQYNNLFVHNNNHTQTRTQTHMCSPVNFQIKVWSYFIYLDSKQSKPWENFDFVMLLLFFFLLFFYALDNS